MKNASILSNAICLDCSWPIISTLNNDGMALVESYRNFDYWVYCSNKTCINHSGEELTSNSISEFVIAE